MRDTLPTCNTDPVGHQLNIYQNLQLDSLDLHFLSIGVKFNHLGGRESEKLEKGVKV